MRFLGGVPGSVRVAEISSGGSPVDGIVSGNQCPEVSPRCVVGRDAREQLWSDTYAEAMSLFICRAKKILMLTRRRMTDETKAIVSEDPRGAHDPLLVAFSSTEGSLFLAPALRTTLMGAKSSVPMTPPCGGAVTAHPITPSLTKSDQHSLHQLYGHDNELLQLMTAAEALRDLAKTARDSCTTHFHEALLASKHEQKFGERLVAMSERMDSLGECLLHNPDQAVDTTGVLMEASDKEKESDEDEKSQSEIATFPETPESARRVLAVDHLSRKLGDAYVSTAVARERVYHRLLDKIKNLTKDLEKAHQVKLQRHAP